MLSEPTIQFTKDNLDTYLKELAKEYRKLGGKAMPAEIVLVGGAAVLAGYGFRDMTTDIDAVIHASSYMKDAINHVGDRFELPNGWLNTDFVRTASYSAKLTQFSTYYRTYSNVLSVRIIGAEYLIAMKLRSGRQYKKDMSDVVGILDEHDKRGNPISMEQIRTAVINLYGDWDMLPDISKEFIADVMRDGDYPELYSQALQNEEGSKDLLVHFQERYPGVTTQDNVNDILRTLKQKQERPSVLAKLHAYKEKQKSTETPKKSRAKTDREL